MNKEHSIAIPADPDDPEDRDVSQAAVERGLMGRRIRRMRTRLGLSQEAFAAAYGIPVANIRQYETGRHMPPPAVRAYLKGDRGRARGNGAGGGRLRRRHLAFGPDAPRLTR